MTAKSLLLSACLVSPLASLADEMVYVQTPATLGPDAPITAAARRECDIPNLVASHALLQLTERGAVQVTRLEAAEPSGQKVLRLTIQSAYGVGGGGWSGPKSIMLRAQLVEDGRVLADRLLRRSSRGGVWGGVTGTCPIFERVAVALGKDVANWVPSALRGGMATAGTQQPPAAEPNEPEPAEPAK